MNEYRLPLLKTIRLWRLLLMDPDTAWKLFTKGITPTTAKEKVNIDGNLEIADVALKLIAVMA
jgi:hypothetical protein